ncbi:MAG: hypothetical protein Kow00121_26990 [Elainellaceae cyanobacterium]
MKYLFEIVGVAPVLSFFNYQQAVQQRLYTGAEYLRTYHCTLDAFINSVEKLPLRQEWNIDRVIDSVILFWFNNADTIKHWKKRLEDAGKENVLIARVADIDALKIEFETLLRHNL